MADHQRSLYACAACVGYTAAEAARVNAEFVEGLCGWYRSHTGGSGPPGRGRVPRCVWSYQLFLCSSLGSYTPHSKLLHPAWAWGAALLILFISASSSLSTPLILILILSSHKYSESSYTYSIYTPCFAWLYSLTWRINSLQLHLFASPSRARANYHVLERAMWSKRRRRRRRRAHHFSFNLDIVYWAIQSRQRYINGFYRAHTRNILYSLSLSQASP